MVYEVDTDSAIAQVEGFCRHLTSGGSFSDSSQPKRDWVTQQLDLDAAYIAASLEEAGYDSTQTDTQVLRLLELWNVFRTCISVELSNPVSSPRGEGNARFQEFKSQEQTIAKIVMGPGLADIGGVVSGGLSELLLATGVSSDRKLAVELDSDHILHRFRRGQFVNPQGEEPTADLDWRTEV